MDYLSLCLICKDENEYLPEWLDYHILMGVDRFYIYDNESRVSLRETLKEYIERGWVVVVDIPGKAMQLYAYDHCLKVFGGYTFWLGFIDTDEFLVPKTTQDLKDLLREYENYGGLAVNSLFFGSNGHKVPPAQGQIAAYTRRAHTTFKESELIKSIVQPGRVQMPVSPHDFVYKADSYCVNESFLRVDFQRFPASVSKIQLNHYYCRSETEIENKLGRGNSGDVVWPRKRFEAVNLLAIYEDYSVLQNLEILFRRAESDYSGRMIQFESMNTRQKLSAVALLKQAAPTSTFQKQPVPFGVNPEFADWMDVKTEIEKTRAEKNFQEVCRLLLQAIQLYPNFLNLFIDLSINYLHLGDLESSWAALTKAWQLAPNSYAVLVGMAFYFFRVKNHAMTERTCQLVLSLDPNNLMVLGFLTDALIGQGRLEDALKVGVPVMELSAQVGELPSGLGIYLVKQMADYLVTKKDYSGAVGLWQAGEKCQPSDISVLFELGQAHLLNGDKAAARQVWLKALSLDPKNHGISTRLKQLSSSSVKNRK